MADLPADIADHIAAGKVLAARAEPYLAGALHALIARSAGDTGAVAVDRWWRLYVDPQTCASWTAGQWATVLRAESRRLLLSHPDRADQMQLADAASRSVFALASDATVNSDTERAGNADWPRNAPRTEDYPGGFAGMAVEEVFELLTVQQIEPDLSVHGSGAQGERQPWEQPEPDHDARTLSDSKQNMLRRQVAELVCDHQRRGGQVSPQLELWANALLTPALDWRRTLDSHVRAATGQAVGRRDYTYTRPSRRRAPAGAAGTPILPGMSAPQPPRVTVIRDTSGSMSADRDLIGEATAEIDGMLHARARVTLIDTDTEAHQARAVRNRQAAARVSGGGGTDLGAGLDAAAAQRPRPHLVVILTDGETGWPDRNPLPGVPVLVALLGRRAAQFAAGVPDWATALVVPAER